MSLIISHLTGGYTSIPVLKDVNFTVPNGKIVGLIGLNGAGKSTTIKHIIGLLQPQKGSIQLNDLSSQDVHYHEKIAYIPETPVLYPELTLAEHLEMTIMAYQLNREKTLAKAAPILKKFRLDNKMNWFPIHFSKGMQQKVMIVCAFMTDAQLFIIDEPFTGLDPLAVHDLLELVEAKRAAGASILMSTHILATAQQYADEFVLLNQGRVRATGTLNDLQRDFKMDQADLDDIYLRMTQEATPKEEPAHD